MNCHMIDQTKILNQKYPGYFQKTDIVSISVFAEKEETLKRGSTKISNSQCFSHDNLRMMVCCLFVLLKCYICYKMIAV